MRRRTLRLDDWPVQPFRCRRLRLVEGGFLGRRSGPPAPATTPDRRSAPPPPRAFHATLEAQDPRHWGEARVKAIGVIEGRVLVVVYTDRGDARRIISFRDAARAERRAYWRRLRAEWSDGSD